MFFRHLLATNPFRLDSTELVEGVRCIVKSDKMVKKKIVVCFDNPIGNMVIYFADLCINRV